MDSSTYMLLFFIAEVIPSPPPGTGFWIDQVGNFVSDNFDIPIVYTE